MYDTFEDTSLTIFMNCCCYRTESCSLTAGSNIFIRVVNRVPVGQECNTPATVANTTGEFIHIEQKTIARSSPEAYASWALAVRRAFVAPVTLV